MKWQGTEKNETLKGKEKNEMARNVGEKHFDPKEATTGKPPALGEEKEKFNYSEKSQTTNV